MRISVRKDDPGYHPSASLLTLLKNGEVRTDLRIHTIDWDLKVYWRFKEEQSISSNQFLDDEMVPFGDDHFHVYLKQEEI